VNLFGGDPLVHPDFDRVLMALQKKGCQIRLWSTGVGSIDRWIAILATLDRLYWYVPSGDPCQYQSIVGTYTWDQRGEQLDVLNSDAVDPMYTSPQSTGIDTDPPKEHTNTTDPKSLK
jgi:hypothetical protein